MDILRAELERLFSLDELKKLSTDLLGLDPEEVGGTSGKGAYVRALVERCSRDDALEALADALLLSATQVDPRIKEVYGPRPVADFPTGATVGPFKVVKKLGEGGIGVVYLAERTGEAGSRVALKVVRAEYSRDRAAVRRYATASRALRALRHDAVAQVTDLGILDDGRPWVAHPFIDGQTLEKRIARTGPFHINEARPIVLSMLAGLDVLHRRGLVHGDVKVENVFIIRHDGKEPTAMLVDLGADRLLARGGITVERTGPLPVFGTPKSLSPEQARGSRADARSDVYAVGVLLYELLAGRAPFLGDSPIDVIAHHLLDAAVPPSQHAPRGWVSKELDDIVLKALAKDPAARWASAGELREALDAIGRGRARSAKTGEVDRTELEAAVKLLEESPADDERAAALEQVVEPVGGWKDAIEAYAKVIETAKETHVKAHLLFRVARIHATELDDGPAAEKTYLEILAIDPDNEVAQQALEERKRAAHKFEDLVELLLGKVERAKTTAERARVLCEIAVVYEHDLNQPANAFEALLSALTEDPTNKTTAAEVERVGKTAEQLSDALGQLAAALEQKEAVEDRLALCLIMARWYDQYAKRPDFAISCYGQALALDPASDVALGGSADIFRRAQQWRELGAILLRRADATSEPARARDWRAEAADILASKLSDPVQAEMLARKVVADDAGHPRACDVLENLLTARGEWSEVVKILEARSCAEQGPVRIETLAHIAEIAEDRLGDDEKAIARYETVLQLAPDHLVALKGCERLYARTAKFRELLSNLERQVGLAATPRQKIGLLERMAAIHHEEFVDAGKASDVYEQVLAIDPDHEAALGALSRLYREQRRFEELTNVLDSQAKAVEDPQRKIELLMQLGRVLAQDIGAPQRAQSVFERVLAVDPGHSAALESVASYRAQTGDATAALSALEKLIESSKDPSSKADLLLRAGRMLDEQGDRDRAIDRYKAALDCDPSSTAASFALRGIYAARGDAHGAAEMLMREIDQAQGAIAKSKLYAELGIIYRERLKEQLSAKEALRKAVELDPTNAPAARSLGDLLFEEEAWEESAKLYEPLLGKVDSFGKDELREVAVRAGDAFRKAGQTERAMRAYLNAKGFAPHDREALERLADLTFETGDPAESREHHKELVLRFGSQLSGHERGLALYRLGESARRANELPASIGPLSEAADLLPSAPEPLAALRKVYESQGKWEEVVRTLRRRMEHAPDEERYGLLVEAGDLLLSKLSDRPKAIKSYAAALELKGDDRTLLTKLMQAYSEAQDWSRLVEVVLRIAELVQDPKALAKYYLTAASISHGQMHRPLDAVDYYNQALDQDASLLKAFDGVVEILTTKTDWKGLEEAYRRQIKRLGDTAPAETRAHLWDSLGEVLHRRLHELGEAVEAYERAGELAPDDRRRLETLAEIYAAEPRKYGERAIKAHARILDKSPYRLDSYKALRKVYTELKNPDASWCVCQALRALNMAEADEEAFFKKHRSSKAAQPKDKMTEELWAVHLIHHDQDPLLTGIFAVITPAVVAGSSQQLGAYGLSATDKVNAEADKAPLANNLHRAASMLAVTLPDVYNLRSDPGGASFIFTRPPAIGLGQAAARSLPPQALGFVAGRHLSFFRGGHYLRHLVPTGSGLRAWLLAGIKLASPQFPVPGDMRATVGEHVESLRKNLAGPAIEQMRSLVQKMLASAHELDMKRWVSSVDLTADRAGFLVANDLEIATVLIKATPEDSAAMSHKDRLRELFLFSVSEHYLALRHKLGLSIGG